MQKPRRCAIPSTINSISTWPTLGGRKSWRRGSVIASWLLDLTAAALTQDPALAKFTGRVSDSGEGRWTIKAAIDEGVPVPVLSVALYERFSSRGEADFADKLLSAMRYEFGGHVEKPAAKRAG
jgi:6-phosphogluconate dehydrogenase